MFNVKTRFFFVISLSCIMFTLVLIAAVRAEPGDLTTRSWKGYAIIGNGNMCAVYSDDDRIISDTKHQGLQHFYFNDYTNDYIASSSFNIIDDSNKSVTYSSKTILNDDFFSAHTKLNAVNGNTFDIRCFAMPGNSVVLSIHSSTNSKSDTVKFTLLLRKKMVTDRVTELNEITTHGNAAVAHYSNNVFLLAAAKDKTSRVEINDSTISITSSTPQELEIIITVAGDYKLVNNNLHDIRTVQDLYRSASTFWNRWINKGKLPKINSKSDPDSQYLNFYKRNLYCVKSANLNGQVPADITGEFVTNNMPQLYPRDAMMCTRVFIKTGHWDEAKQIIEFWNKNSIPKKSKGEWFARYDAHAYAVDAGSGAKYDEPEWDANGYYIQLLSEYHKLTGEWLAKKEFIYELADFLVNKIDKNGLLYEGGIVEWTGYLPATNLTCAAALLSASDMAKEFGDSKRMIDYKKASLLISENLHKMFDSKNQTYADKRYTGRKGVNNQSISNETSDTLYLWDTSLNFGILWGYPGNAYIIKTNEFYEANTVKLNGGVQYFDSPDPGLAGYGHDLFFFTTSAAAQYQIKYGNKETAKKHIDWMIKNSNIYGLMPERIYLNESDCSPATPLSWCCAEFALTLLMYFQ